MPNEVVSHEKWLQARIALLQREKAHTLEADSLARARASLPWVKITKPYTFIGADNTPATLPDLFRGKKQLVIQHVMFDPSWPSACRGCSFFLDNLPLYMEHLNHLETVYVAVARAPYEKIHEFCKERMKWPIPFYSSWGSEFNYDFNVTLDESVAPVEYNYSTKAELLAKGQTDAVQGEQPGLSVFVREGDDVYHTYSTFARGMDHVNITFALLDLTPLGRQVRDPALSYHDVYGKEEMGEVSEMCH